jgi:hypothetical protein
VWGGVEAPRRRPLPSWHRTFLRRTAETCEGMELDGPPAGHKGPVTAVERVVSRARRVSHPRTITPPRGPLRRRGYGGVQMGSTAPILVASEPATGAHLPDWSPIFSGSGAGHLAKTCARALAVKTHN